MIPALTDALAERGFDTLTPVQEAVTAPDLEGQDLLVSAQTGSGKTVGFGLAIAPTLLEDATRFGPAAAPLSLVVAPTRELAFQVMRELSWLFAKAGARVTSCVGGMDFREERRALDRGAHIVVGTPGRLRDHIERATLDMTALRAVVLDEADEMLDLGFREDLEFILGAAPADRRTLLFSATVPPTIAKLAEQYQRDAKRISTRGGGTQHADIAYQAVRVAATDSEHAIFNLLRFHDADSAIVFANTRAAVNHLTARLANRGFSVVTLSGELSQSERTHALQAMRDGRARICVATDVAARGLDLPNLNLVVHADLPTNTETLLHRSGRTGRAGRKGISALIVPPRAVKKTERLLKWAKISAEWVLPPSAEDILRQDEARLLSDPAWDEPVSAEQADFAAKLLAERTPEAIAAAYLRLFRARQSAPEELSPPDLKPAPREHKDFGPSAWFSLSVGRNDRAEPRWLLPLLLRAGNLDKAAVGAIRVQDSETYVELTESSAAGFRAAIGGDGVLEEGITARALDGPPDLGAPARSAKPSGAPARNPRKPRAPAPGPARKPPAPVVQPSAAAAAPAAPEKRKPRAKAPRPDTGAPATAAHAAAPPAGKPPRNAAPSAARAKPKPAASADASDASSGFTKPAKKPGGKYAKPYAGKSGGKPGAGKPYAGKSGGGKPGPGKPKGKPGATSADARDSSKRFVPPGKKGKASKPGKPARSRSGGNEPPRRSKR